jgi:hypothetical protein
VGTKWLALLCSALLYCTAMFAYSTHSANPLSTSPVSLTLPCPVLPSSALLLAGSTSKQSPNQCSMFKVQYQSRELPLPPFLPSFLPSILSLALACTLSTTQPPCPPKPRDRRRRSSAPSCRCGRGWARRRRHGADCGRRARPTTPRCRAR